MKAYFFDVEPEVEEAAEKLIRNYLREQNGRSLKWEDLLSLYEAVRLTRSE